MSNRVAIGTAKNKKEKNYCVGNTSVQLCGRAMTLTNNLCISSGSNNEELKLKSRQQNTKKKEGKETEMEEQASSFSLLLLLHHHLLYISVGKSTIAVCDSQ